MNKRKVTAEEYYDELFNSATFFREAWEGRIGVHYRIPKEIKYLVDFLKEKGKNLSILEVGAGDGLQSKMIKDALRPKQYVVTDLSAGGVKKMGRMGIAGQRSDATSLAFKDDSFDVVCCFNVMHHVDDPGKMAQEMLRVTKKYFLLCEANALSLPRKILEMTPRYRKAGEKSYTPSRYGSFFRGAKRVKIKPFMFAFPFTPDFLYGFSVATSEMMEKIPLLKWLGSSVLIYGEKV